MRITAEIIKAFGEYLTDAEKSPATVEKYIRDVTAFYRYTGARTVAHADVLEYKDEIREKYKVSSVNSMLSSLNSFFTYCGREDLRVRTIKVKRAMFSQPERELTKREYERLLKAADRAGDTRLYYIIMTLCALGLRVSELKYITVEAISRTYAEVTGKGKTRTVMIPQNLCRMLKRYAQKRRIRKGSIFITRTGKPIHRGNIWSMMKKLCRAARVEPKKIFPHNLRHLFAVTFYSQTKDIVKLADVMGHSDINTTRIYTVESGKNHRRILDSMGLVYVPQNKRKPQRQRE